MRTVVKTLAAAGMVTGVRPTWYHVPGVRILYQGWCSAKGSGVGRDSTASVSQQLML